MFKLKNLLLLLLVVLTACATYQSKVSESRNLLREGRVSEALEKLKLLAEKPSDDQLVYLLDYGVALQIAKEYKQSNEVFLKADKLADLNDYHSVSNVAMAALGSEEMLQYKGESYEKILINAYLAINYLMLDQHDDALVETRRLNDKINKFRQEGRKDYEQNPFAHYLGGLIWEADHKYDDAYISYMDSYKIGGASNPFLPEDLIRAAKKSKRLEDYKKWKEEFPAVKENPDWYDKKKGELIIIGQVGWGPEKHFSPHDQRFPKLYSVSSMTHYLKAEIQGQGEVISQTAYDLEGTVIKTLDADVGWMIARKLAAIAAKEVMADQIRQKNQLLGDLTWIFMRVSDRADLRQWSTLPKDFQVARLWLPAGKYTLTLQGFSGAGQPTADFQEQIPIEIKPNKKTFFNWRSLR